MREALRALLQAAAARNHPPRREDPNRVRPRVRRCEAMISYSLLRDALGSVPRHAASSDM